MKPNWFDDFWTGLHSIQNVTLFYTFGCHMRFVNWQLYYLIMTYFDSSGIDSWSSSCLFSTSSTFFCGVSKASLEDADSKLIAWGPSKLRSTGRTTRLWNKPKVTTRKNILKKDVNTWDLESARRMNANVVVIPPFKTAGPILVLEIKRWLVKW